MISAPETNIAESSPHPGASSRKPRKSAGLVSQFLAIWRGWVKILLSCLTVKEIEVPEGVH